MGTACFLYRTLALVWFVVHVAGILERQHGVIKNEHNVWDWQPETCVLTYPLSTENELLRLSGLLVYISSNICA